MPMWFGRRTRRISRWRGRIYHRLWPETFGRGVRIGSGLFLDRPSQLRLEDGVIVSDGCLISCGPDKDGVTPRIRIGSRSFLNINVGIAAHESIDIGIDVGLGPGTIVVDADHEFTDPFVAVLRQGMRPRGPITIGDGAWVGAGAVILGGTTIAPRSVVAANAVVRGHFDQRCLLAGAPARVVRLLDEDEPLDASLLGA
jgi:acetyltransferase-like isoleucine patch superfamily enzyme